MFLLNGFGGPVGVQAQSNEPATEKVLTLSEAVAFLRVPVDELAWLADLNEIPGRKINGEWRFNRAALLAWLNGDREAITSLMPPSKRAEFEPSVSVSQQAEPALTTSADAVSRSNSPRAQSAEDVFLRGQKLVLRKGEMSVETGIFMPKMMTGNYPRQGAASSLRPSRLKLLPAYFMRGMALWMIPSSKFGPATPKGTRMFSSPVAKLARRGVAR